MLKSRKKASVGVCGEEDGMREEEDGMREGQKDDMAGGGVCTFLCGKGYHGEF